MIENLIKWSKMPDMSDLVAESRIMAKKASDLFGGK